jgi:hypothetical protein
MNKINWGRVILGGVVAGIVMDVIEYVLHTYVLAGQEGTAMTALGAHLINGAIPIFMALGILTGIVTIWFYAAARPRYGAGAGTAVIVATGVWILGYAIPDIAIAGQGLFSMHLMGTEAVVGLVEVIVATVVGAALYKE